MFRITMENEGGELDSKTVKTAEQAAQALVDMIERVGEVCDGDHFFVREID